MDKTRPSNRHIPVLDGLRACAIIFVILCHVNFVYGGPLASGSVSGPLSALFGWGWIGVDLFFVLSGFLITGILWDAKGCDHFFQTFYARRTLRIMPLYFGFLFLIVVMNRLHCSFFPRISLRDLIWLSSYTYNFKLAFTERLAGEGTLHHFWSLAVEEHFYLLWPLAVFALPRRTLLKLCLGMAAASFALRAIVVLSTDLPHPTVITPCRLDGLLLGSFVALCWRDPADWLPLQRYAGRLVFGSGCLLLAIAIGPRYFLANVEPQHVGHAVAVAENLMRTVVFAALAVCFAGLVALAVGATNRCRLRRLLESPGMLAIGKYSYAIYVFHTLILLWTVRLLSPLSHAPPSIAKPLGAIWVLAASFAAAWLSYHLYEKHFLRLKRFFEYGEPVHHIATVPSHALSYNEGYPALPGTRSAIPDKTHFGAGLIPNCP
jgi:peptidoglycan/LPS O-acetylase OafA/YrhL